MNAITKHMPLTPAPAGASSKHIAKMFALMMSANGGDYTEAIAAEYVGCVRDFPEWAIAEASEAFRHGKVGDGKFVPTPGELAIEVRRRVDNERARQYRASQEREQLEEQRRLREFMEREKTPEARERVRLAHERWKASYAAAQAEIDHDRGREEIRAQLQARHDALFAPSWKYGGPEKWERTG